MAAPVALPLWKKLCFSGLVLGVCLLLLEGALALVPRVYVLTQGITRPEGASEVWVIFTGDSVTAGYGAGRDVAYPQVVAWDLQRAGASGYGVYNLALAGAQLNAVQEQIQQALAQVPPGVRPVVLAMVGHNDLQVWETDLVAVLPDEIEGPQGIGGGPRLLRLLRWFGDAAKEATPRPAQGPQWEAHYGQAVGEMKAMVEQAGGRFYLLTYALPGIADPAVMGPRANVLRATRTSQVDANNTIRLAAEQIGAPLIDVERLAKFPEAYDSSLFVDNIHLTAAGHMLVADAVRDQLVLYGDLPRQVYALERGD